MDQRIWHTRWVNRNRGTFGSFLDRRQKLEFHGSKVTSDTGFLAYRELDDALKLTEMAGDVFWDNRTGKNAWHGTTRQFRQSLFGRLGGYDDVNDADRLGCDPAMRWIVGGKAIERYAASTSQLGRFETELLASDSNLAALTALPGAWIDRVPFRKSRDNAVRLQLHALAYNLANFMRTLALPKEVEHWSLTRLREKLVKIGAKVVSHGRYVTFQLAEVVVPKGLFRKILSLIDQLRRRPIPA